MGDPRQPPMSSWPWTGIQRFKPGITNHEALVGASPERSSITAGSAAACLHRSRNSLWLRQGRGSIMAARMAHPLQTAICDTWPRTGVLRKQVDLLLHTSCHRHTP